MANSTLIDPFGRSEDDRNALRARRDEVNRYAQENWYNQEWRRQMVADMTETIYRGFTHENLLALLTTVENLGWNERAFIKEIRGLRAYWVARGGYIQASTTTGKVIEVPRDTVGFHVYEFEDKIMANFAETQATLIQLGIERLDAEVNSRFLRGLQAAIPSSSDNYMAVSGVALSDLNTALTEVRDASRSQNVTIIGRAPMTQKILNAVQGASSNGSGFMPNINEQLFNTGVIGNYRGANIVTLVNWLDDTDTPFFPANELYIVGTDASKFAFFGGLRSKEWDEEDVDYWHYRAWRDCGLIVHRPDRVRRIVDSTVTAYTVGS